VSIAVRKIYSRKTSEKCFLMKCIWIKRWFSYSAWNNVGKL